MWLGATTDRAKQNNRQHNLKDKRARESFQVQNQRHRHQLAKSGRWLKVSHFQPTCTKIYNRDRILLLFKGEQVALWLRSEVSTSAFSHLSHDDGPLQLGTNPSTSAEETPK